MPGELPNSRRELQTIAENPLFLRLPCGHVRIHAPLQRTCPRGRENLRRTYSACSVFTMPGQDGAILAPEKVHMNLKEFGVGEGVRTCGPPIVKVGKTFFRIMHGSIRSRFALPRTPPFTDYRQEHCIIVRFAEGMLHVANNCIIFNVLWKLDDRMLVTVQAAFHLRT
jgi:hypothetical protein